MRTRRIATVAIVLGVLAMFVVSSAGVGCSWIKKIENDIWAGQTEEAGNYQVIVYSDRIEIKFWIDSVWCLEDNHILVTKDLSDYTNKKMNPKIGKFPFEAELTGSVYSLTLWKTQYPEFWTGSDPLYIAIHVVVTDCCGGNSETGWGFGEGSWGSSWGWYFDP